MDMAPAQSSNAARKHQTLWRHARRAFSGLVLLGLAPLLGGCQIALLDPKGPIGADEKSIIILATCLMLIVVVPVIVMTLAFAWRYRASNTRATFAPNWSHSNKIEVVVWLVPCLIIAVLATVTWISTHKLDPYREIAAPAKPLDVEVASLDWKWLFIYPQLKIATVNELAFPVDVPVRFHLTSSAVMNAFFIPRLGTQIYTMAGMETRLSLMANAAGTYRGISANYSGGGFSDMTFKARAMREADFQKWVAQVRAAPQPLTMASYRNLAQPSEKVPVTYFSGVPPHLFHDILNQCTNGGMCMDKAMKLSMANEHAMDKAMKLSMANEHAAGHSLPSAPKSKVLQ
jgi:cytochrome o ubiquinol oxidase subunit 2